MFTWPSRGSVWAYGYDRESANYSRDALERLLQFLSKDPAVGEISVLAHSMGNWVALEALRQMAIRGRARQSEDQGGDARRAGCRRQCLRRARSR